jgi:hypothetical protein
MFYETTKAIKSLKRSLEGVQIGFVNDIIIYFGNKISSVHDKSILEYSSCN